MGLEPKAMQKKKMIFRLLIKRFMKYGIRFLACGRFQLSDMVPC